MAYTVMASMCLAYLVMAYAVMRSIFLAYAVMAYVVTSCVVVAHLAMTYGVMGHGGSTGMPALRCLAQPAACEHRPTGRSIFSNLSAHAVGEPPEGLGPIGRG